MKAFKITYSFTDGEKIDWTVTILADDSEKALTFLSKVVDRKFTMTTIELLGKVDGIADEIIHRVLSAHGLGQEKKEKPVKPVAVSKQEPLVLGDTSEKPKRTRGKRITTNKA